MSNNKIKVAELFAGVGGFRLGLEGWNGKSACSGYKKNLKSNFEVVWSNQWEPATKLQHASDIYVNRFGEKNHSNIDIAQVNSKEIPDYDMLVGGFPCQDYSVAKQLSQSQGISGKKGVLWWEIHRLLVERESNRPNYVFLENVDRLLKSPVTQRGRDFAIILASLSDLGYAVEWRVINAADYGFPQRRRRVFILAYHKNSAVFKNIKKPMDWITKDGTIASGLKVSTPESKLDFPFIIEGDLVKITKFFNKKVGSISPFQNTGIMIDRQVWSVETTPDYNGKKTVLGDILQDFKTVPNAFFINEESLEKWKYLKGAKKEPRKKSTGEIFYYVEGPMSFPDPIDRPARTIITSEGGQTASRFKHVISQNNKLRRLTPIELERANMFPDNHTIEAKDNKRAFFMGNALVVGIIEIIGNSLIEIINKSDKNTQVIEKVNYSL